MSESQTVPFSAVKVGFCKSRGIDDVTAGSKTLRNYVRSNFDYLRVTHNWPQEGKDNRDGNRYADVPRDLADMIMSGKLPTAKAAAAQEGSDTE